MDKTSVKIVTWNDMIFNATIPCIILYLSWKFSQNPFCIVFHNYAKGHLIYVSIHKLLKEESNNKPWIQYTSKTEVNGHLYQHFFSNIPPTSNTLNERI